MPTENPPTTAFNNWCRKEQHIEPPRLDRDAMRRTRVGLYAERGTFSLLLELEEKQLQTMRGKCLTWPDHLIHSTVQTLDEFPTLFGTSEEALSGMYGDWDAVAQMERAHNHLSRNYAQTGLVRRYALVLRLIEITDKLQKKVEDGEQSGTPDPAAVAAHERFQSAVARAELRSESAQDRVRRAFEDGHGQANADASLKDEEIRFLRAQVEALSEEIKKYRLATAAPPDPVPLPQKDRSDSGRRQSPR